MTVHAGRNGFGKRNRASVHKWDAPQHLAAFQAEDTPSDIEDLLIDPADAPIEYTGTFRPLSLALGLAVVAMVSALFLPAALDTAASRYAAAGDGVDPITTATPAPAAPASRRYVVRRSVLQKSPGETCIIHASGRREGDC